MLCLFRLFVNEVFTHGVGFLRSRTFEGGLEKEEFEHGKHDEEFDECYDPERLAPGHAAQTLGIDAEKGFECCNHDEKKSVAKIVVCGAREQKLSDTLAELGS